METGSRIKSVCVIVVGLALGLFIASEGQVQVIHPDQIIGVPSPQSESGPGASPTFSEPSANDMEKGFDRPMMVPESGVSGSMDMNKLKTPDATDAENARESDRQSSVSF
ncbi:MAG: hypothetical protein H8K10_20475 [Nitrospira sp.]|nr:hypothetical protein [Nitrospira sp.]